MATLIPGPLPPRFAAVKREIADSVGPDFEQRITTAWVELLAELAKTTAEIEQAGSKIIPQVSFAELDNLTAEQIADIKQRGCVVIKDVVDDQQAAGWKTDLKKFDEDNPSVPGFPEDDKQFFNVYWTKPQVEARAHPNVLKASARLNEFYHANGKTHLDGVDLKTPLSYADRYRIRKADGKPWSRFPPHVDGGSIERWEDPNFRSCFADILKGQWRDHDAYDLEGRIHARSSMYGRPNQASVFRTYQGWLAMSEIGQRQSTICFFPDVVLSNAYTILRPFFRLKSTPVSEDPLAAENWEYDITSSDFPGIYSMSDGKGYAGPRPNTDSHPHFNLDKTMTPIPRVSPGDMVFWHSDLIHSVVSEFEGTGDSSVMYIGAVPTTKQNVEYIARQRETFERGITPPDYPEASPEISYVGIGRPEHIVGDAGRHAMGFPISASA
ncbi:DUF1479-domain-containing protein [Peniophora sp. CONT]|nr:DUF1479-domain-containing protein [Peniophora sp. CONT]